MALNAGMFKVKPFAEYGLGRQLQQNQNNNSIETETEAEQDPSKTHNGN